MSKIILSVLALGLLTTSALWAEDGNDPNLEGLDQRAVDAVNPPVQTGQKVDCARTSPDVKKAAAKLAAYRIKDRVRKPYIDSGAAVLSEIIKRVPDKDYKKVAESGGLMQTVYQKEVDAISAEIESGEFKFPGGVKMSKPYLDISHDKREGASGEEVRSISLMICPEDQSKAPGYACSSVRLYDTDSGKTLPKPVPKSFVDVSENEYLGRYSDLPQTCKLEYFALYEKSIEPASVAKRVTASEPKAGKPVHSVSGFNGAPPVDGAAKQ